MQRGTVPTDARLVQPEPRFPRQKMNDAEPAVQQAPEVGVISITSGDTPPKTLDSSTQSILALANPSQSLPVDTPPALPKSALVLHPQLPVVIEHLHHEAARAGHSHAELVMNPSELGRIRFDLITQGDQVQVTLAVERPETLDLLRANAEGLRQELRAAGLNADTLNFGQWSQRAPQQSQPESMFEQAVFTAAPQAIPIPYVKPVSAAGLDLRL
jgi:flagellar hook-length control protein FliK